MINKLLRCLRLEKMILRWGKSGVVSNVELGMLLILPCVVLASFLSTTVACHHSPPVACHHSPPVPCHHSPRVPSAPSPAPSPPFCSRSVATTIGSALLALISLMKDAWGEASAQVAFTQWSVARFWHWVLLTIVYGLNPIVGTFYVLQTMFVYCKYSILIGRQRPCICQRYEIAKAMADTWVTVGFLNAAGIPPAYILVQNPDPDPELVLNLAGTVDADGNREFPIAPVPGAPAGGGRPVQLPPGGFYLLKLSYEGMLALLLSGALDDAHYQQLRFLGRRTGLESFLIILQSMSYITAVVYRRIEHLKVSPIEGIGFACSLLFLVYVSVQMCFGSRSQKGLVIYLTTAQEITFRNFQNPNHEWWLNHDLWAFIMTFLVGLLVAGVATGLVYPVWATKNMVDMLGPIIFFGDFLLQFIFFIFYFRECLGPGRYPNLLLTPLVITGIIALAGVAFTIYATIRHWHDQSFDIPTPLLGRYFPFIR